MAGIHLETDCLGLSKPLTKLIEVIASGVGKIYTPIHIKRMANANKSKKQIAGNSLSTSMKKDTELIEFALKSELAKRTAERMVFHEIKKQKNIESVVEKAYKLLESEKEISNDPVDPDWISRFFDNIGDISTEEMQQLWGKILAGEVKRPKSFSLRTLDVLRNMTKEEANTLQKVACFSFYEKAVAYIPAYNKLLVKHRVSIVDIRNLQFCGLLSDALFEGEKKGLGKHMIVSRDYVIQYKTTVEGAKIPMYRFTQPGLELLGLINEHLKLSYVKDFCEEINHTIGVLAVGLYEVTLFSETAKGTSSFSIGNKNFFESDEE